MIMQGKIELGFGAFENGKAIAGGERRYFFQDVSLARHDKIISFMNAE